MMTVTFCSSSAQEMGAQKRSTCRKLKCSLASQLLYFLLQDNPGLWNQHQTSQITPFCPTCLSVCVTPPSC